MPQPSRWGWLWGSSATPQVGAENYYDEESELAPLNPFGEDRNGARSLEPHANSRSPTPASVSPAASRTTSYYFSNSWSVVRVEHGEDELEVRLFSGYGRIFTMTGFYGIVNLGMFHLLTRLHRVEHWHFLGFAATSSLLLVVAMFYYALTVQWLDTISLDRLVVTASEARIEHVFGLGNALLHRLGVGRSITVHHGGRLKAQVVTFPIKSLTGCEEASALEIADGVRFGAQLCDDEQGANVALAINNFLQSLHITRASYETVIERPGNSRVRMSFKDKDVARIEVPAGRWLHSALYLFSYQMLMGCCAVVYAFVYAINSHRPDRYVLAIPMVPLAMLFFVLLVSFMYTILSSLATDIVEVGRLHAKTMRKSWVFPAWISPQVWTETSVEVPVVRLSLEGGVPAAFAQGLLFAQSAGMDDLAYITNELQRMTMCQPSHTATV